MKPKKMIYLSMCSSRDISGKIGEDRGIKNEGKTITANGKRIRSIVQKEELKILNNHRKCKDTFTKKY